MTQNEKQTAIDDLCLILAKKVQRYNDYVKKDEILEVKKNLRLEIKEIEKQINDLKDSVDGQLL